MLKSYGSFLVNLYVPAERPPRPTPFLAREVEFHGQAVEMHGFRAQAPVEYVPFTGRLVGFLGHRQSLGYCRIIRICAAYPLARILTLRTARMILRPMHHAFNSVST